MSMINGINSAPIGAIDQTLDAQRTSGPNKTTGPDFGEALANAIGDARALEKSADTMATQFAAGDPAVGMHETMIASEKASIGLRYAVTLKNKLLEAYRELMNTPV